MVRLRRADWTTEQRPRDPITRASQLQRRLCPHFYCPHPHNMPTHPVQIQERTGFSLFHMRPHKHLILLHYPDSTLNFIFYKDHWRSTQRVCPRLRTPKPPHPRRLPPTSHQGCPRSRTLLYKLSRLATLSSSVLGPQQPTFPKKRSSTLSASVSFPSSSSHASLFGHYVSTAATAHAALAARGARIPTNKASLKGETGTVEMVVMPARVSS